MSGVKKLLWLPFAAMSLLLLGCGVPISPEAVTATAVAERETASPRAGASAAGSDSNQALQGFRTSTAPGVEGENPRAVDPIATLTVPEAPEAEEDLPGDASEDEAASELAEDGETEEGGETGDLAVENEAPQAEGVEATPTPEPFVADAHAGFAEEFLALLNAQRTDRGLQPLSANVLLNTGATQYAAYMGTANFFGHYGPDGSTPVSRTSATRYPGAYNGEAVSAGQPTPQSALNALLASAPHAEILLDPRSVEVGIGYAFVEHSRYRHYWVVIAGIP